MTLFLDIDDVCRAPLAAALYEKTHPGKKARSAGVYAVPGTAANPNAVAVGSAQGISLAEHASRSVKAEEIETAEAVYCLTEAIAEYVRRDYPDAAERIRAIETADPFGTTEYTTCAQEIARKVEALP